MFPMSRVWMGGYSSQPIAELVAHIKRKIAGSSGEESSFGNNRTASRQSSNPKKWWYGPISKLPKKILTIVFLLALTAFPACSSDEDDFRDGLEARDLGNHKTALEKLRPLGKHGFARAQKILGNMYAKGQGVPKDYVEAVRWFRLAAEQGHVKAQYNLGLMHVKGWGVPKDYGEAGKWWRKAAEQGHAGAQYGLGVMSAEGKGVPLDSVQAHMWYNLAAGQGDESATKERGRVV